MTKENNMFTINVLVNRNYVSKQYIKQTNSVHVTTETKPYQNKWYTHHQGKVYTCTGTKPVCTSKESIYRNQARQK